MRSLLIRDITTRYRGSILGIVWAVIYPLTMLALYTFVFGVVFKARWNAEGSMADFVQMLYCGLIIYAVFSDTLTRSPGAILAYPSFVKKVVFPLELLPLCHLASALFTAIISVTLLCLFLLIQKLYIPLTALFVPVVFAPFVLLTAGVAWVLAATGVFLRDIGHMIGLGMSALLFLSPVFYPVSSVPPLVQKLLYLNPLTYPMQELRHVLVLGLLPNLVHWLMYTGVSILVALCGLWTFQHARRMFADIM